jgi:hypothetical protein
MDELTRYGLFHNWKEKMGSKLIDSLEYFEKSYIDKLDTTNMTDDDFRKELNRWSFDATITLRHLFEKVE